jgi:hypothetical protein
LEEELKKTSTDLINEKIKSQEYLNEMTALKSKFAESQNDNLQHLKTIDVIKCECEQLKSVEKELQEQLNQSKSALDNVNI